MGAVEIVIIVVCVLAVIGVVTSIVVSKIKGKPSCCSDCAGCKYAKDCNGSCHSTQMTADDVKFVAEQRQDKTQSAKNCKCPQSIKANDAK